MNTPSKILTALAVSVLLTACPGSGGDSSSTTTTSTNIFGLAYDTTNSKLYIANAGRSTIQSLDPSSLTNTPVTLAGSDNVTGTTNGDGTAARFYGLFGLVVSDTIVLVADTFNNTIRKVSALTGTKTVTSYATAGGFNQPTALAASLTDIYVADSNNHAIKKISLTDESVLTWAGLPGTPDSTTDVSRLIARFNLPMGIAIDAAVPPNIYVSDSANHTIRKIDSTGNVTTIAGTGVAGYKNSATGSTAQFNLPTTMVLSGNSLYVTDTNNHAIRIINVTTKAVDTFAGFGAGVLDSTLTATPGSTNGIGAAARFTYPRGIAIDNALNLYIGDQTQTKLRKVTVGADVTTFTTTF